MRKTCEAGEESDGDEKEEMRVLEVLEDGAGSEPGVRSDAGVDGDAAIPPPCCCWRCRCMSLL